VLSWPLLEATASGTNISGAEWKASRSVSSGLFVGQATKGGENQRWQKLGERGTSRNIAERVRPGGFPSDSGAGGVMEGKETAAEGRWGGRRPPHREESKEELK